MFEEIKGAKIKEVIEYISECEAVIRLDNEEVLFVFAFTMNIKEYIERIAGDSIRKLVRAKDNINVSGEKHPTMFRIPLIPVEKIELM